MVDFSYPLETILKMAAYAASLLILDHHKTAEEVLRNLPAALPTWDEHVSDAMRHMPGALLDRTGVRFDMEKSGCVLAWQYFHPREAVPAFLLHMQDRDLWKFKLHDTRAIAAATFSYPYEFPIWDQLVASCNDRYQYERLVAEGKAIQRKQDKDIAELLPLMTRRAMIGGYSVPIANLPYQFASDAAGKLAENAPFAAVYWDGTEHRNFSLRSRGEDAVDVSEIAKWYGGGGHRNAAGFRVPLSVDGDFGGIGPFLIVQDAER